MKKIYYLFLAIAITNVTQAQNPLPNPSFENWGGGDPISWEHSSGIVIDSPGHTGNYAVKGVTASLSVPNLALGPSTGLGGMAMFQSYNYLNFYYKFIPIGNEYLSASVDMKDFNGVTAASGYVEIVTPSAVFRAYSLPIMNFYAPVSCKVEFSIGWNSNYPIGSVMIIDDVSLSSTPLSVDEIEKESSSLRVFPNPANNFIQIHFDDTKATTNNIQITDMLGRVVKELNTSSNNITTDISDLPAGNYIVAVKNDEMIQTKRLVVE